eukprot:c8204_g1_i1.p1 GENE.c8204_g1_i1~~c8204_g1_i1.p1  ORF type:complete len:424 (+),score=75.07 c8204_g1_i1:34-1305(+)
MPSSDSGETYPNEMVRVLHDLAHVASSNEFDASSRNYWISIGCLGAIAFITFSLLLAIVVKFAWIQPMKSKRITRHKMRVCSISMFVLTGLLACGACLEGWDIAVHGVNGITDGLGDVCDVAEMFQTAGSAVDNGVVAMNNQIYYLQSQCPELSEIILECPIVKSLSQNFSDNSVGFTHDMKTALRITEASRQWVIVGLAVPVAIIGIVCFIGLFSASFNSLRTNRLSQVLAVLCVLICALVVSSEIMASVTGGDLCYQANNNTLGLINDILDHDSYEIAEYYSTCVGTNTILQPLSNIQHIISPWLTEISRFENCSTRNRDIISTRVSYVLGIITTVQKSDDCQALKDIWNSLVHTNLCDRLVPGVAWLWIIQLICVTMMVGAITCSSAVSASFRSSLTRCDERTHLFGGVGLSDAYVVPQG